MDESGTSFDVIVKDPEEASLYGHRTEHIPFKVPTGFMLLVPIYFLNSFKFKMEGR